MVWDDAVPNAALLNVADGAARAFTNGERYPQGNPVRLKADTPGDILDISFGAFDMIVTRPRIGERLSRLCGDGLQRVSALVDGEPGYEILNPLLSVPCFDTVRSTFLRWEADGSRPDKVGELRMVTRLAVSAPAASGYDVFRIREWMVAVIVSEEAKTILQDAGCVGVKFLPV